MLKIENTVTPSAEWMNAVVMGVRNPYNSWEKSDSKMDAEGFHLGHEDAKLMIKLATAGNDHGKFLRMMPVICDITAPLYWWKEMDQYKVGTVTDSCSTMHKIADKPFTLDDFSWEHLLNTGCDLFVHEFENGLFKSDVQPIQLLTDFIIPSLNVCREKYLETKNKDYWWQMIQLLPSSYNQKRTWSANYQVLNNIYHARKGHRLDEWQTFREWIESLVGFQFISGKEV